MSVNINNFAQEINTPVDYAICNCGRAIKEEYPPRLYKEFWLKEPDGKAVLYNITDLDDKEPYEAIEEAITTGAFVWDNIWFDDAPIFILATMQGGE